MNWPKEQTKAHEDNFERFRQAYIDGENKVVSASDIYNDKRRCATLIRKLVSPKAIGINLFGIMGEIANVIPLSEIPGFYFQELPHFTIDCHRYLTDDKLPGNINSMSLQEQQDLVISPKELETYGKIVKEVMGSELSFKVEIKGLAFGGDGLVAQVWYDNRRMGDLTGRLGDKVREEIPSMDFVWGMVGNKVSLRVVNLLRFLGKENKEATLNYIDENRDRGFGMFDMDSVDLLVADHYLQQRNIKELGNYCFSR